MAEVLGAASGVAGLLSLTIEIVKLSKQYIEGVSSARKDVEQLVQELQSLKETLWQIDALNNNDVEARFAKDMEACAEILRELLAKLKERFQGSHTKVKLKRLTWPFSEKRTMEQIQRLHRYLSVFQTSIGVDTNKGVRQILQEIEALHVDRQTEKFKSTLRWLSSLIMEDKHEDNLSLSLPGSGSWFLEHPEFQQWVNAKDRTTLWCPGDPGSGKTIMAATIIEHITKSFTDDDDDSIVIFTFCDYKDSVIQTALELLANLSKQLCANRQEAPPELAQLASSLENEGRRPNLQQAERLFRALCSYYKVRSFLAHVIAVPESFEDVLPDQKRRLMLQNYT